MITQTQVREYARVSEFDKLKLIDEMIKALQASKQELRDQLVAEGKAEYKESFVDEYTVRAHYRKRFIKC